MTMTELVPAMRKTIFNSAADVIGDYAEIGIDAVLESDALKAIPVVGTISAACKVGYNLHERNLIKQTIEFLRGFNEKKLDQAVIDKHRVKLEANPVEAEKELERVIILLGNHIENQQSIVLGSFYSAYVRGAISWEKFCELAEVNRRMFVNDYEILQKVYENDGMRLEGRELYPIDRLISLGLLQLRNRLGGVEIQSFDAPLVEKPDVIITSLGKTFCQHFPDTVISVKL